MGDSVDSTPDDVGDDQVGRDRPQPHGGVLKPPPPGGRPENFDKAREEKKKLYAEVAENPDAPLEAIHQDLTSLTKKILRRAEREGKVPTRATMDVIREFRQTQEAVNEARKSRGALAEAGEILAAMDAKIEAAATRMGADPVPPVEIPA